METCYTLAGFLVAFLYLKYSDKYHINVFTFYLYRFLRLTPAILAMVLVHISFIRYVSNGPLGFGISNLLSSSCYYTGWATLMFLTGYVPHVGKVIR